MPSLDRRAAAPPGLGARPHYPPFRASGGPRAPVRGDIGPRFRPVGHPDGGLRGGHERHRLDDHNHHDQLGFGSDQLDALGRVAGRFGASPVVTATSPAVTSGSSSPVSVSFSGTTSAPSSSSTTTSAASTAYASLNFASFSTDHNLDWGDSFSASGSVTNSGTATSDAPAEVDIFASSTAAPSNDAVLVGTIPIAVGVTPGSNVSFNQTLQLPPSPMASVGSSPSFFLTAVLAPASGTPASAATVDPQAPMLDSVVTITPNVPPNLVGSGLSVSPSSVSWGDSLTVSASVTNLSQGSAPPTNARIVLTPSGQSPGGNYDYEIGQVAIPAVGAQQTVTASQTITLPIYAPAALAGSTSYTVTMIQDAGAVANPVVTAPNPTLGQDATTLTISAPATAPATPQASPADLRVDSVQEPSPALYRGSTFPVSATVENAGAGQAGAFKVRFLYEDNDDPSAPELVLGDVQVPSGLAPGYSQNVVATVKLPYRLPDGFDPNSSTARIVAVVDPDHTIDDSNPTNNRLAGAPIALRVISADGSSAVATTASSSASSSTVTGSTTSTEATTAADGTPETLTTTSTTATTAVGTGSAAVSATTPAASTTTTTSTTSAATTKTTTGGGAASAAKAASSPAPPMKATAKEKVAAARAKAQAAAQAAAAKRAAILQARPKPKTALKIFHPAKAVPKKA